MIIVIIVDMGVKWLVRCMKGGMEFMTEKRLNLSDIFDIEIVLKDGNKYYELEFEDYLLDGFDDFPIRAVLKKGKSITKKEAFK